MGDGRVLSVNVGRPREFEWLGRRWTSAIWKEPVEGRVAVRGVNVEGDDQADRRVHGGPDKALYAYSREDAEWWETELGREVGPGSFGENLTLTEVDVTGALIGERWKVGAALLEVSQPRVPCFKLGARMNDPDFPRRFAQAGRPGAYLRIVGEGDVAAGDQVRVVRRPGHRITVGDVGEIYHREQARARLLLDVPELSEDWRAWAENRLRASRPERLAG